MSAPRPSNDASSSAGATPTNPLTVFMNSADSKKTFEDTCKLVCSRSKALFASGFGFDSNSTYGTIMVADIDTNDNFTGTVKLSSDNLAAVSGSLRKSTGIVTLRLLPLPVPKNRIAVVVNWQEYHRIDALITALSQSGIRFHLTCFSEIRTRHGYAWTTADPFTVESWERAVAFHIHSEVQLNEWKYSLERVAKIGLLNFNNWHTSDGRALCAFLCAAVYNTWMNPNAQTVADEQLFANCDFETLRNTPPDVSKARPSSSSSTAVVAKSAEPLDEGTILVPPCLLCMVAPRNICLIPCGHIAVCSECVNPRGSRLTTCVICRAKVERAVTVFFP
jgi:hypothetical protein